MGKSKKKEPHWTEYAIQERVALGPYWNAIVMVDGSVLLQNCQHVLCVKTGNIYNLSEVDDGFLDNKPLVNRTLGLAPDGSVTIDPHGLSLDGQLSEDSYDVLDSTVTSLRMAGTGFLNALHTFLESTGRI